MKYPKLPKAFKKRWVAALRSGKFKQGKNYLRTLDTVTDEDKYCCLGVACKIQGCKIPEGVAMIELGEKIVGIRKVPSILIGDEYTELPMKLATFNDEGNSFKRIATWIEKNL